MSDSNRHWLGSLSDSMADTDTLSVRYIFRVIEVMDEEAARLQVAQTAAQALGLEGTRSLEALLTVPPAKPIAFAGRYDGFGEWESRCREAITVILAQFPEGALPVTDWHASYRQVHAPPLPPDISSIAPPPMMSDTLPAGRAPTAAIVIGILMLLNGIFFLVAGGYEAITYLLMLSHHYQAWQIIHTVFNLIFACALLVPGIGLICRARWARSAAVLVLVLLIVSKIGWCFISPTTIIAPPEEAGHDLGASVWVLIFYGILIRYLNKPAMRQAFK